MSAEQFRKEVNRLCVKHGGENNGGGCGNPRFGFPFAGGMTVKLIDGHGWGSGFIAIRFENQKTAAETGLPCPDQLNRFSGKWNIQGVSAETVGTERVLMLAELKRRLEHFTGPLPENTPPNYVAAEQRAFNFREDV